MHIYKCFSIYILSITLNTVAVPIYKELLMCLSHQISTDAAIYSASFYLFPRRIYIQYSIYVVHCYTLDAQNNIQYKYIFYFPKPPARHSARLPSSKQWRIVQKLSLYSVNIYSVHAQILTCVRTRTIYTYLHNIYDCIERGKATRVVVEMIVE